MDVKEKNTITDPERRQEEYYEKLGAILRTLDECRISDDDRAALIWAALDYYFLLGQTIESVRMTRG